MPDDLVCHAMQSLRRTLRVLPHGFATFDRVEAGACAGLEAAVLGPYACRPHGGAADMAEILKREKLAMAVCHAALLLEGRPYGGYVREIHSGKPFKDIDIVFASCYAIQNFKGTLVPLLHRVLHQAMHAFELALVAKLDTPMPPRNDVAYAFTVHKHQLTWEGVTLQLDLTHRRNLERCIRTPATLGSGLQWDLRGGITLAHPWNEIAEVSEVCALLSNGKDIPCFPTHEQWSQIDPIARRDTHQYYARKHAQLAKRGYTLLAARGITLDRWWDLARATPDSESEDAQTDTE